FEAIAEKMHADGIAAAGDWRRWPVALRDVNGPAVAAFAAAHVERVEFHAYLQWQFDTQLDAAGEASAALGLGVGLLQDLAVGILALESQRNRCMVIGEDLGTVPDEVRTGLERVGVLSSRPLYFAHDADGEFIASAAYSRDAVVSIGTHDLATLKGFWVGADLDAREALSPFPLPE